MNDGTLQTNIVIEADLVSSSNGMANMSIHADESKMDLDDANMRNGGVQDSDENQNSHAPSPEPLPFVVDTVGDSSLAGSSSHINAHHYERAASPAPSDSSEEVVVFHGRNRPTVINDPVAGPAKQVKQQSPHVTDDLLDALQKPVASASSSGKGTPDLRSSIWGPQPSKRGLNQASSTEWSPAPEIPYRRKTQDQGRQAGDEATAQETISALQADWKKTLREKKSSKKNAGSEGQSVDPLPIRSTPSSRRKKRGRKKDNRALRAPVASDDDMSETAYDDYMRNLVEQELNDSDDNDALLKAIEAAHRPSAIAGPSLVVNGKEYGDDEVLDKREEMGEESGSLQLRDDDSDWESDDSEMNPDLDELSEEESLNASDLEDELEYTERQQWEDEEDLRQRRLEQRTDENVARLLQKQAELGMAGDELLIEDGSFGAISDDGFGDIDAARAGLVGMTSVTPFHLASNKSKTRTKRGDRKFNFPDATALADTVEQYGNDGFDIMDFERPSLRPKKKGRKGRPELEALSDDDLREVLQEQWENDRSKKAQRRLEREELRREGLLGSAGRKGRADLGEKYQFGMTMVQVHDELRTFLLDTDLRERAFPPMDKTNRKALHEIAIALNLNSKSQGAGKKRFPIIYKTSRTEEYSHEMFGRVIQASSRGFLGNPGKAKKFARKNGAGGMGRKGGTDAATIRHGELVGGGAAEIGKENFGHRLMEKMGWKKGTALGKDGEGLLLPVEQRMRVGTAGLG